MLRKACVTWEHMGTQAAAEQVQVGVKECQVVTEQRHILEGRPALPALLAATPLPLWLLLWLRLVLRPYHKLLLLMMMMILLLTNTLHSLARVLLLLLLLLEVIWILVCLLGGIVCLLLGLVDCLLFRLVDCLLWVLVVLVVVLLVLCAKRQGPSVPAAAPRQITCLGRSGG